MQLIRAAEKRVAGGVARRSKSCMRTKGDGDGPSRGVLIRQRFNSDFDVYASEDQQRTGAYEYNYQPGRTLL
jgi:hypothetical protein